MSPADHDGANEPRLLIKRINGQAEEAGALATALGLPLVGAEHLLGEAKERGITEESLRPLRERLDEIDRLKATLAEAKAQRATRRL